MWTQHKAWILVAGLKKARKGWGESSQPGSHKFWLGIGTNLFINHHS